MACPTCGAEVQPGARFCDSCGVELLPSVPRSATPVPTSGECLYCKKPNRAKATFCANCGLQLREERLPLSYGADFPTRWAEINWQLGGILGGILGFVVLLLGLSLGSLVVALFGVVLCLVGFAEAVYFMGHYP